MILLGEKVTMQDIADKLGVTKVSVSKAINNQPGISDKLREQILKTSKALGYIKTKHTSESANYNLALVCPKRFFLDDESFYTTIYYYINKRCTEKGFPVSCFVINEAEEVSGKLPAQLLTGHFDGIFISGELQLHFLEQLEKIDAAKIAIDFYRPELKIDSIVVDNFLTGLEVTNYLIQKGHKKIGFVGDIHGTSSICDRYFGYLKALSLNHLPIRQDWHIYNSDRLTGLYSSDFPLPDQLPTAFVCHCDKAALVLMQKLSTRGISVPQQVSILSFDNTNVCELLVPRLTSVDINRKQIAYSSIDKMLYRINHPDAAPQKIYLGSHLIERDSVSVPPNDNL